MLRHTCLTSANLMLLGKRRQKSSHGIVVMNFSSPRNARVTKGSVADPTNRTSSSVDALNNMACFGLPWHKNTLHFSANTSRVKLLINLHSSNFDNILGVVKNHDIQAHPLSEFPKERGRAFCFCYDILAASSQVLLNRAVMGTVACCDYSCFSVTCLDQYKIWIGLQKQMMPACMLMCSLPMLGLGLPGLLV